MSKYLSFFIVLLALTLMVSCSDSGKAAKTKDAEKVAVVKTNNTSSFKTIKDNSHVAWRASHLGGVQKRFGKISVKDATLLVNNGKLSNATVIIDMAKLTVENFPAGAAETGKLTGHLKSPDFFNITKFPTSKFELTNLQQSSGPFNSSVTGNLTILGVTKSITFNANVKISDNEVTVKSEDFTIDRRDWGLSYNTEGTAGVPVDYLISNDIGFTIDVALTK